AEVSASANGRNGVGAPPATARPARTGRPLSPAARAASRTSRDLPIPASPVRNTVLPRPVPAAARAARSRRASSSRPTRTGHSTCGTGSVSAPRAELAYKRRLPVALRRLGFTGRAGQAATLWYSLVLRYSQLIPS